MRVRLMGCLLRVLSTDRPGWKTYPFALQRVRGQDESFVAAAIDVEK